MYINLKKKKANDICAYIEYVHNSHITGFLEAISNIIILLVAIGPLLGTNVHQDHEPAGLVVTVGQSDGPMTADAA